MRISLCALYICYVLVNMFCEFVGTCSLISEVKILRVVYRLPSSEQRLPIVVVLGLRRPLLDRHAGLLVAVRPTRTFRDGVDSCNGHGALHWRHTRHVGRQRWTRLSDVGGRRCGVGRGRVIRRWRHAQCVREHRH
uniref:Uncharacterized protein n=1 Tax=Pararge aegeria TaxID=116150 RepID=S4PNK6_9NEOP